MGCCCSKEEKGSGDELDIGSPNPGFNYGNENILDATEDIEIVKESQNVDTTDDVLEADVGSIEISEKQDTDGKIQTYPEENGPMKQGVDTSEEIMTPDEVNLGFEATEEVPLTEAQVGAPNSESSALEDRFTSEQKDADMNTTGDATRVGSSTETTKTEAETTTSTTTTTSGTTLLRALYDLPASLEGDLSLQKGDLMQLLTKDGDWWEVTNIKTNERGFVPCNYVVEEDSLETFDWFHGKISRVVAVELLNHPDNEPGTFLIRESGNREENYTLSVLANEKKDGRKDRHHRILRTKTGEYQIQNSHSFTNLHQLVIFYQQPNTALHTQLQHSCPKVLPTSRDLSRQTRDEWEIDRSSLELQSILGSGNFGQVWKAKWENSKEVAVKILKDGTMSVQKFLEEAATMKKLHHENLVQLYAVCTKEDPIMIVTEFMVNGSLLDYLRRDDRDKLEFEDLILMCQQVARAMHYIEVSKYVHRDIAARNVLVGQNKELKLADFGMARLIEDDEYRAQEGAKFPYKWTALEAIHKSKFTIKSDVWSYGILMVEILTQGAKPYPGITNVELVTKLDSGYRHPKPTKNCPDELYDVMLDCWKFEPEQRPSFKSILESLQQYVTYEESNFPDRR